MTNVRSVRHCQPFHNAATDHQGDQPQSSQYRPPNLVNDTSASQGSNRFHETGFSPDRAGNPTGSVTRSGNRYGVLKHSGNRRGTLPSTTARPCFAATGTIIATHGVKEADDVAKTPDEETHDNLVHGLGDVRSKLSTTWHSLEILEREIAKLQGQLQQQPEPEMAKEEIKATLTESTPSDKHSAITSSLPSSLPNTDQLSQPSIPSKLTSRILHSHLLGKSLKDHPRVNTGSQEESKPTSANPKGTSTKTQAAPSRKTGILLEKSMSVPAECSIIIELAKDNQNTEETSNCSKETKMHLQPFSDLKKLVRRSFRDRGGE